ncbi:unnamed protein product [Enterobius vermicularis]|uniref:Secreted protein n=1 Tax=Enterobius vermicularis TaxID=51028 RepID=A0A0N4V4A0_ENTVE|nr:unnamed protein product [Enterobius vermicularis]
MFKADVFQTLTTTIASLIFGFLQINKRTLTASMKESIILTVQCSVTHPITKHFKHNITKNHRHYNVDRKKLFSAKKSVT